MKKIPVFRNILMRNAKLLRGVLFTYIKKSSLYNPKFFWNEVGDKHPLYSDRDTIGGLSELAALYHYASTEKMICLVLSLTETTNPKTLLDIGSGSGHWVDYFLRIFSNIEHIDACEISKDRCEYLSNKFINEKRIDIHNVSAEDFPVSINYDIICMIGCAFHIVDDKVMLNVLSKIGSAMNNSSVLIFNDLLPILSHGNQFSPKTDGYFKYVRSKRKWRNIAKETKLKPYFLRNYDWIRAPLYTSRPTIPEGHIVFMMKE